MDLEEVDGVEELSRPMASYARVAWLGVHHTCIRSRESGHSFERLGGREEAAPGLLGLRFLLEPCGEVSVGGRAEVEALGEVWMGRELIRSRTSAGEVVRRENLLGRYGSTGAEEWRREG
jgi:hypothetical protein